MSANRPHNIRTYITERWLHTDLPCHDHPVDTFFPDKGDRDTTRRAKQICARCHVINECLAYALKHNEPFGIWGGLLPHERATLLDTRLRR